MNFLYIHTLDFTDSKEMSWAFQHLSSSVFIEDILTDPEKRRLRFVAHAGDAATLIERIYQRGGLTWCQRSRFRPRAHLRVVNG